MISILRNLKYLRGGSSFMKKKSYWVDGDILKILNNSIYLANHDNCGAQRCGYIYKK